jgi:hypothetical protein
MIRLEEGSGDLAGLKVRLDGIPNGFRDPQAISNADGTFEISRVGVGSYRVVVESGRGSDLRRVQFGDVASSYEIISLPCPDGALVLTLGTRGAHLAGAVFRNSDQQVINDSAPRIVLVPNEPAGKARVAIPDRMALTLSRKCFARELISYTHSRECRKVYGRTPNSSGRSRQRS